MSAIYNPSPSFQEAAAYLSSASALGSVSNAIKLELYAIFKYLTVSPTPNTPKPSLFDFTGKAKWDAWKSAGETYKDRAADAEVRYLEIASSLGWTEGRQPEAKSSSGGSGSKAEEEGDGDEDDIWDKDEDTEARKSRGEEASMGHITSTMVVTDEGSSSALTNFAIAGDVEGLAEYLQEHSETDINAVDENGYTPLHLAADRGHFEMVKALLERGADAMIKDEDEYTAKELAEIAGHNEIVSLLTKQQNASS